MLSTVTVVSALNASLRPLRVPSSVSPFPPAAVTQCIWSAWRSIVHKLMVRQCPECVHGGWSGLHDEDLRSLCRRESVPMPERISGETTVRQAVQDYQLRTFTSNDAPEPREPPGSLYSLREL